MTDLAPTSLAPTSLAPTSHPTAAHPSRLLRTALAIDAALSGLSGLLMLIDAPPLGVVLGLPTELLRYVGLALLPWAAVVGWLSRQTTVSRRAVWAVIGLNGLWALDCVLLLVVGPVAPTSLGIAFVIVQAVAVAGLAELQWFGLRRSADAERRSADAA